MYRCFRICGIEYKVRSKMPFRMNPMDSAGIGGVGRTSGNFDVRYTVLVRKEEIEYARSLTNTQAIR